MSNARHVIGWDVETFPILVGLSTPKQVCMSWAGRPGDQGVCLVPEAIERLGNWLLDPGVHLVAHHGWFDIPVVMNECIELLPLFFDALNAGRIHDTEIRQKLLNNAFGVLAGKPGASKHSKRSYAMDVLVSEYYDINISDSKHGPDSWRLRYNELHEVPVEKWPRAAYDYALNDAIYARDLFHDQGTETYTVVGQIAGGGLVVNEKEQVEASVSLGLSQAHGLHAEGKHVGLLKRRFMKKIDSVKTEMLEKGIIKLKPSNKTGISACTEEITRRLVAANAKLGITTVLTEKTKKVSLAAEHLEKAGGLNGDPVLGRYVSIASTVKMVSTYIGPLEDAAKGCVCPSYDPVLATGRISSYQPNATNQPRKFGIRSCFVPRPGFVFVAADYSALEMCTLAQTQIDFFGASTLGDAINAGQDVHLLFAADMEQVTYEYAQACLRGDHGITVRKRWKTELRQGAKAGNFGFPGGSGARAFVDFAWSTYGYLISEADAEVLKANFVRKWNMKPYFDRVSNLTAGGKGTVKQSRSGRVRGGCYYTQACNTYFQGLAADGAKRALWEVTQKCYNAPSNVLFGSRVAGFFHDEIMLEIPDDRIHEGGIELETTMTSAMRVYTPDVRSDAGAAAMLRWYKEADPVFHEGRRTPWYKMGFWDQTPTKEQVLNNGAPWPITVLTGPAEFEQQAHDWGIHFQAANTRFDAAFDADYYFGNQKWDDVCNEELAT